MDNKAVLQKTKAATGCGLKNFVKFIEKHLRWSLFVIKLLMTICERLLLKRHIDELHGKNVPEGCRIIKLLMFQFKSHF